MELLRNGTVDAIFIYDDQVYNFGCASGVCDEDCCAGGDRKLWDGFGTKYAYIHTGMMDHAYNGTTLSLSKGGSGLSGVLDPCIAKFLKTDTYHELCVEHGLEDYCYENEFFSTTATPDVLHPYAMPTNEQSPGCSDGYCSCLDDPS